MRAEFSGPLLALISDASIDFTPSDFDSPLAGPQRAYLKAKTGVDIAQVFWRKQVHEDQVLVAQGGARACQGFVEADAYITREKNLPIAIRTADCVPVFIYDPAHQAIGLAHAGWKGTYKMIAAKTVRKMKEVFQSRPQDLKVFLGPCIRECCYEVGKEFRDVLPGHVKEQEGRLYADVAGANRDQLLKEGILRENIQDSGSCTYCDKNYFSYRRDGAQAGRMISLMMLI